MATLTAPGSSRSPGTANLSTAQVGNGASTNIADIGTTAQSGNDPRGTLPTALVKITTAIGATPTCTYALEVSPDGTNWLAAAYADSATPTTVSVATFVQTTATTVWKVIRTEIPWRFFRITYSANTNVTNTADIWTF